jgi:DNA-binding MarR family transcriptional regulator
LVARLVDAGHAERRTCDTDGRVQFVSITDEGRQVLSKALTVHLADLDELFTGRMTSAERETIVRVMERIRQTPAHS